ncbi:protein shisa-6-like isoform X7 [Coregonus clupeaformis]|uniref:protein shisa-6-like isoform X7 n=1 Tax=Coregonus clupeaformis TaxID=59861 RepID=UPI001BDF88E0|nr:protein shisa-6-like isoform X7 [Coregonus clupeaformis]
MGIRHLFLLLIYLDPLSVLCAGTGGKKMKPVTKRTPKAKDANITAAVPTAAPLKNATKDYDTCTGYYDVSGQFDKEFACNNTVHRYCCGSCFLRFCCQEKEKRVDQSSCKNYNKPDWVKTPPPSPASTGQPFDPSMDQTNTAVYITCGIIAFILVVGVSAKVAYDKATEPPQEMNIHRALADILRQQGPIPISQYDCENFSAMNGSPKDNTPQRTSSKNHYTPVHQSKSNHGLHYGKESVRSSGGHDLHTFISSGFVTLGRGQPKGTHQHNYNHTVLGSPTRIHNADKDVDDYYTCKRHLPDLAARSTLPLHVIKMSQEQQQQQQQQLQSQPPQPQVSQAPPQQAQSQQAPRRQRPPRVQRAMSQDRVLSPNRDPDHRMGMTRQGGRILSDEQLLSADRLMSQERLMSQDRLYSKDRMHSKDRLLQSQDHMYPKDRHFSQDRLYSQDHLYSQDRLYSQDPLISPDKMMMSLKRVSGGFRGNNDKSMSHAISHPDVFMPTTPLMDHYKMTKMHSHPSASNNAGAAGGAGAGGHSSTLAMNHTTNKRQQFASRRTHTVEQLHYMPQQHYRTGSKTEVTV